MISLLTTIELNRMKQLLWISLLFCYPAISQSYFKVDSLFGINGVGAVGQGAVRSVDQFFRNVDGSYFIAGNIDEPLSEPPLPAIYPSVVKVNSCGKIDSSYGFNGKYYGPSLFSYANSFLFAEDGSFIVSGFSGGFFNYQRPFIEKVNNSGTVDYNFSTSTLITEIDIDTTFAHLKFISSELVDTNKLFCTGFYMKDTIRYIVFVRYYLNGSIDTGFGNNGIQLIDISAPIYNISSCQPINESEKLFFCNDINEQLIVIKTNGNLIDPSFAANGYLVNTGHSNEQNLLEQNNFLVASTPYVSSEYHAKISRYKLTGEIDTTFGENGVVELPLNEGWQKLGLDSLPDNRYLIGGRDNNYFLDNSGKLDSTFTPDATLPLFLNNAACVLKKSIELSDNEIVFAGISESPWGYMITRLTKDQNVPHLVLADDTLFSNVNSSTAMIHWFFDGNEIANQTSFITLSETGQYVVQVSDTGGCTQLSDTLQIIITADKNIIDESTSEHIIYPNPSNEFFMISNGFSDDYYEIYSAEGKCVQNGRIEQKIQTIGTDELETGIYLFSSQKGLRLRFIVSR